MKYFLYTILFWQISFSQSEKKDTVYILNPVLVTATTAIERETPVTFSNLKKEDIKERYSFQDIPVMLSQMPSVTMYSDAGSGVGYSYLNLRGFDQRRVSVMINGVPQNDPEDHNVYWIDFPDLLSSASEVQIQRGAGSAFYGPPAIGGSVNIVTNPFQLEKNFSIESVLGFQTFSDSSVSLPLATKKISAQFNSGLVNGKYLFYGKVGQLKTDGYRERSWVEHNSYFVGLLRMDENIISRFHFFGGPIKDGLVYSGLPKFANNNSKQRRENISYWEADKNKYSVAVARSNKELENFSQPHSELINEWRVNSDLTIHNTIFYYPSNGFFKYDGSWADSAMLRTDKTPTNTLIKASVELAQWGAMPRIEYTNRKNKTTFGLELNFHNSTHFATIDEADGIDIKYIGDYRFYEYSGDKKSFSVFANEIYKPIENLSIMMNFQYVYKEYNLHNEKFLGNEFKIPYNFINPRVGVNYNLNENENIYFSLAYTTREPRLRNLYAAEDAYFGATPQFEYDTLQKKYNFEKPYALPEKLLDVEIGYGLKNDEGLIRANLYFMDFYDELVKSGRVDIFGQPVWGNALKSRHIGAEFEWEYYLSKNIFVSGNFTISNNKLIKHSVFDNNKKEVKLDGNPISGFPEKLGNLRLSYRGENYLLSLYGKYNGEFYTDNFKNEENKNESFSVLNFESSYKWENIFGANVNFRFEVHNLLNKFYTFSGEGGAFYPAAERSIIFGATLSF